MLYQKVENFYYKLRYYQFHSNIDNCNFGQDEVKNRVKGEMSIQKIKFNDFSRESLFVGREWGK